MDKQTFQKGMAYLAAGYRVELAAATAAVYWDQLAGLRDEAFLRACKAAVASDERFPSVALLRRLYIEELRQQAMAPRRRLPQRPATPPERAVVYLDRIRRRLHGGAGDVR